MIFTPTLKAKILNCRFRARENKEVILANRSIVPLECTFVQKSANSSISMYLLNILHQMTDILDFFPMEIKTKNHILMSGDSSKFDHVVKYKKGRIEGHRTFEKRTRTKCPLIIKIGQAGQMWLSCHKDLN